MVPLVCQPLLRVLPRQFHPPAKTVKDAWTASIVKRKLPPLSPETPKRINNILPSLSPELALSATSSSALPVQSVLSVPEVQPESRQLTSPKKRMKSENCPAYSLPFKATMASSPSLDSGLDVMEYFAREKRNSSAPLKYVYLRRKDGTGVNGGDASGMGPDVFKPYDLTTFTHDDETDGKTVVEHYAMSPTAVIKFEKIKSGGMDGRQNQL